MSLTNYLINVKLHITNNNSVLLFLFLGVSTYRKSCLRCGMIYRYQQWEDGIHNFDDHVILSLHLCLMIRNALQTHTAVSKVIEIIETTERVSFPNKERILHAYLHFEALTNHDYAFTCVSCGYSPAVVVMDLHKKGVFSLPVSEIQSPPDDYDGHVDIVDFRDAVAREMLSRGLIPVGRKNPFIVPPSYHHWSPWIGPHTRKSNSVLNTEYEKIKIPKESNQEEYDLINEERLSDELLNLKVQEVRALCKKCGVDSKGSKMDLVLRLWEKMSNRSNYNKVFEKVWGASGGWAVITCPCGVVYSVKFNLRAESPRDFVDMLLSWKHFPNVVVYDYARGLALHANRRQPGVFGPFHGRLLDPTPENIQQVSEGKVLVNMPWLRISQMPAEKDGHPLTGSAQHFALNDVFHQGNSKDKTDALRKLELVPELAGLINSQCVEQLFSGMRKNNYFLNMTTPSTHIFLQRNILHHYNMAKNQKAMVQYGHCYGCGRIWFWFVLFVLCFVYYFFISVGLVFFVDLCLYVCDYFQVCWQGCGLHLDKLVEAAFKATTWTSSR
ncbi:HMG domain-containing protein 3-like [Oryzias latipes]